MNISINFIEKAINKEVENILGQMKGNIEPRISRREAISKLGTISSLVLNLYEQSKNNQFNDEELEKIWNLKVDSDKSLQILFEKVYE